MRTARTEAKKLVVVPQEAEAFARSSGAISPSGRSALLIEDRDRLDIKPRGIVVEGNELTWTAPHLRAETRAGNSMFARLELFKGIREGITDPLGILRTWFKIESKKGPWKTTTLIADKNGIDGGSTRLDLGVALSYSWSAISISACRQGRVYPLFPRR